MKCVVCGKAAIYDRYVLLRVLAVNLCAEHEMAFQTADGVTELCDEIDGAETEQLFIAATLHGYYNVESTRQLAAEVSAKRAGVRKRCEVFVKNWIKTESDKVAAAIVADAKVKEG